MVNSWTVGLEKRFRSIHQPFNKLGCNLQFAVLQLIRRRQTLAKVAEGVRVKIEKGMETTWRESVLLLFEVAFWNLCGVPDINHDRLFPIAEIGVST